MVIAGQGGFGWVWAREACHRGYEIGLSRIFLSHLKHLFNCLL
jgi:hypothetical protein